jgi:ribosomal protein S18 acetylase RimI-like enzyme
MGLASTPGCSTPLYIKREGQTFKPSRLQRKMIRKATKKDLPALYDLYIYFVEHLIKSRPGRYSKDRINQKSVYKEFENYINGGGNLLIYEEKGRVAGYGIGKIKENELFVNGRQHGELYQIVVRAESQNNGIGKALASELINWMRSKGIKLIYGLVDLNNKESLRVWSKIGFKDELVYIAKEI